MTKAEIRRERLRVVAALRKVQRRLCQKFDVTVYANETDNVMAVWPTIWPQDPLAFTLAFCPALVEPLSRHEIEQDVYHEVVHMIHWPLRASATAGMSDDEIEVWGDTVWEPVVREITRRTAPYVLGRPWVGGG